MLRCIPILGLTEKELGNTVQNRLLNLISLKQLLDSQDWHGKADFKHYYVRFKTTDSFNMFKKHALELSHPYYVFEGDVQKVLRVKREYHDIVELEPLDHFDITNTLAKILGLRSDY